MIAVQDLNAELPENVGPVRLRVSVEGTTKSTQPLELGSQEVGFQALCMLLYAVLC